MPVPTRGQFLARFGEFVDADDAVVDGCIAEAALQTPESVWGDLQSDGIMWLAAKLLATSPNAKQMRIEGAGRTLYDGRREELERLVSLGPLTVGRS